MDKNIQNFIKNLKSLKLSSEERSVMRSSILRKIDNLERGKINYALIVSPWAILTGLPHMRAALASFLIVTISGSTMAFAAEQSLPGDILYPIKIELNENVARVVSTVTTSSKIEYEAKVLEKRLLEAEKLHEEGGLSILLEDKIAEEVIKQEERAEKEKKRNLKRISSDAFRAASFVPSEPISKKSESDSQRIQRNRSEEKESKEKDKVNNTQAAEVSIASTSASLKVEADISDDSDEDGESKGRSRDKVDEVREKHQEIIKKLKIEEKKNRLNRSGSGERDRSDNQEDDNKDDKNKDNRGRDNDKDED